MHQPSRDAIPVPPHHGKQRSQAQFALQGLHGIPVYRVRDLVRQDGGQFLGRLQPA